MDYSNAEFYALQPLEIMVKKLKELDGIKQSKENCRILLAYAHILKKSIVRIISEIDKCCQKVSNLTLKRHFHEAKGKLLTKSGDFYQLFGEITSISNNIIIDGELLVNFVNDFEDLVQYFAGVLIMHDLIYIELASVHINTCMDLLDGLNNITMPDSLEVKFSKFCINITNLWPLLRQLGRNIVNDPRNINIDATYKELKYMCNPLGKTLSMAIFHPTNKSMKDQKLAISQRIKTILTNLKNKLELSADHPKVYNGYLTEHINEVTNLLDQFRNKTVKQMSHFLQKLECHIIEVIKYVSPITYTTFKTYGECNTLVEAQMVIDKLGTLSGSLETLNNCEESNERVKYFSFCHSYENLLKRIDICYANQILEEYSDPLMKIQDLITSIKNCGPHDDVKDKILQCSLYCDKINVICGYAISKSSPDRCRILIQLLSTLEWLEEVMTASAMIVINNDSNLPQFKLYARIWGDCVMKLCSALDELINPESLIHVAGIKFKELCTSLNFITGERKTDISIAKGQVVIASNFACHLLQIQKVNPFYNGSHKLTFTNALKTLSSAAQNWDDSTMNMLEAVNNIEFIQGTLQLMHSFDDDTLTIPETNTLSDSVIQKDESFIVNESSYINNTSIDISCFLTPIAFRK